MEDSSPGTAESPEDRLFSAIIRYFLQTPASVDPPFPEGEGGGEASAS